MEFKNTPNNITDAIPEASIEKLRLIQAAKK
jgi:hypothetical protein